MMRRCAWLIVLVCAAFVAAAEEITLSDGEVLHEARVLRHDGESATISHSTGVQQIPYTRLSPELQLRLHLRPEDVEARREKARLAEKRRAEARAKREAEQRAALEASGRLPRYMAGADVAALYAAWGTLPAPTAEFLAAEWNRREALRCGLPLEAQRFREDAAVLSKRAEEQRAEEQELRRRLEEAEAQLRRAQQEAQEAQARVRKLEQQNAELAQKAAASQGGNTTVVISEPRYVPVYRPAPVVLPPVPQPQPRPVIPPPVRPGGHGAPAVQRVIRR